MTIKFTNDYSPNFSKKKRSKKNIHFIILHYTGMKSEKLAIRRLLSIQSEVACHFLIRKNGNIINIVPELYSAWHAGKSSWKKHRSLNKNSIGIEIVNSGHNFKNEKFTRKQITSLKFLLKKLIKKYNIKKNNILGHSDISPDRKKDPGEKFPWKALSYSGLVLWHKLSNKFLKKNRRIICNPKEMKFFFKNLKKIGYKITTKKTKAVYAFQRRFRPELVDGVVDKECFFISLSLKNL